MNSVSNFLKNRRGRMSPARPFYLETFMMRLAVMAALFFYAPLFLAAQHQPVFSDLEGDMLIQALQDNYSPAVVLPFSNSRDTLFSRVDAHNDSLTCVYSGYTIYLDPTQDPTQVAFAKGINTEHTYPRAFGADQEPAMADMHHLFPTREDVNAARANLPFVEIPDAQTQTWYYQAQHMSGIPGSNIDQYSEFINTGFEPREDHKGNVARAMFYFYTIYRAESDAADPNFFWQQRETLCQWHALDPVDEREWARTWAIASYQDGKPNPFVLDCTLASRCYCEGIIDPCVPVAVHEPAAGRALELQAVPNPASGEALLYYYLPEAGQVQFQLFEASGRRLDQRVMGYQPAGVHSLPIQAMPARRPFLLCRLQLSSEKGISVGTVKIIVTE
ncbi:MAG: endonuclease [Phaeodactylibacter sp.]|nr:endonuclease [Phaeodactylibacter sp.]